MLEYGHFHPDQTKYPAHRLLKQGPNAYGIYQRVWGTSPVLQDTYNADKGYGEESNAHPVFVRAYKVLRSDYLVDGPSAKGQPLTGIIAVKVANGGSGYSKDFPVSFTGGAGSGAVGLAIVTGRGVVDRVEIMAIGSGYTSAPNPVFSAGGGTGATATAAIQPASAVLTIEKHNRLPADDPYYSLFDSVVRVYETMPSKALSTRTVDESVRGQTVLTTVQRGLTGTLAPESGNGIIASRTADQTAVVEERTTRKVESLPAAEKWAFWDFVPLPLLLFGIDNVIFCNFSPNFKLVSRPDTDWGSSQIRKHRRTISYHNTYPNTDYSSAAPVTADIRYQGNVISFGLSNVLNDAISYYGEFITTDSGGCAWVEEYDFQATAPSATEFLAGAWYVRSATVRPWGTTGFVRDLVEYYSAPGNPSI